jgi:hypothetical protein
VTCLEAAPIQAQESLLARLRFIRENGLPIESYSEAIAAIDVQLSRIGIAKNSFPVRLWLKLEGVSDFHELSLEQQQRLWEDLRDSAEAPDSPQISRRMRLLEATALEIIDILISEKIAPERLQSLRKRHAQS